MSGQGVEVTVACRRRGNRTMSSQRGGERAGENEKGRKNGDSGEAELRVVN